MVRWLTCSLNSEAIHTIFNPGKLAGLGTSTFLRKKKMKIEITIILTCLVLLASEVSSQENQSQTHSSLEQKFDFDNESGQKTIKLQVGQQMDMIGFNFQSTISSGSLEMSIFDPNGKREGGFILEAHEDGPKNISLESKSKSGGKSSVNISSNSGSNSSVGSTGKRNQSVATGSNNQTHQYIMQSGGGQSVGSMNKQIDNPIPGTWSVQIEMKQLNGDLALQMMQQGQD